MRLIIIPLLYILAISCSSKEALKDEQLAVIAAVYKGIPKVLPPPPPPLFDNEVEQENHIDYSQLKPIIFNYAINENFVYYDFDYINGISNRFQVYKSKELFEERTLDSSYMKLVAGLAKLKNIEKINQTRLDKLFNEDLVFWGKQSITKDEKDVNGISGVLSFSEVSFNDGFTRAAVVVGDYFERTGNGIGLYILVKIDNKWVIKYTKTLMMS